MNINFDSIQLVKKFTFNSCPPNIVRVNFIEHVQASTSHWTNFFCDPPIFHCT